MHVFSYTELDLTFSSHQCCRLHISFERDDSLLKCACYPSRYMMKIWTRIRPVMSRCFRFTNKFFQMCWNMSVRYFSIPLVPQLTSWHFAQNQTVSPCLLDDTGSTEGCGFKESVPIMQLFVACLLWFTWIFSSDSNPLRPSYPTPTYPQTSLLLPLAPCFVNTFLDPCPFYSSCVFNCLPFFCFSLKCCFGSA